MHAVVALPDFMLRKVFCGQQFGAHVYRLLACHLWILSLLHHWQHSIGNVFSIFWGGFVDRTILFHEIWLVFIFRRFGCDLRPHLLLVTKFQVVEGLWDLALRGSLGVRKLCFLFRGHDLVHSFDRFTANLLARTPLHGSLTLQIGEHFKGGEVGLSEHLPRNLCIDHLLLLLFEVVE